MSEQNTSTSFIKRLLWRIAGVLSMILAYIGLITPGIPFSHFVVFAAYCFAKSSPRMHRWLYNHKHFGPFLKNWNEKRIFPTRGKYIMILTMMSSLSIMWLSTGNVKATIYAAITMAVVAVFVWLRYPGSEAEWEKRQLNKND